MRAPRHLAAVVAQPRRRGRVRARHAARAGARARTGSGCADDDGRAADETVLATLLELAERRGLAAVSPTVADADDPDRLAFPVRRGLTWHRSRAALAADVGTAPTTSCCPASPRCSTARCSGRRTLDVIGVPDLRLFVRGDEVEMHRRLVRSEPAVRHGLGAAYLHPRGRDDDKPMLGGRLHAQRPRRRGEALLHLPQPRLPRRRSRGCAASGCWSCPGSPGTSSSPGASPRGFARVAAAGAAGAGGAVPPRLSSRGRPPCAASRS